MTDVTSGTSSDSLNPQRLQGAGSNSGEDVAELLVVAGLPLRDYPGPTFEWPLGVRSRAFFSADWPGRSGPPEHIERDVIQSMGGFYSEQRRDDVRFVASSGDVAERLRGLFAEASVLIGAMPRSLVTRDAWSDEYLVVLGSDTVTCTPSSSSGHHGDACADTASFADGTPNGENFSHTSSFDAP